jgi:hypothetical protein
MSNEDLNNDDDDDDNDFSTDLAVMAFSATSTAFIHKEPLFNEENHEVLRDKNGNLLYKMNYDAEKHRNFHKNLLLNYDVFVSELQIESQLTIKKDSPTVDEVLEATKKQIEEMTDAEKEG